MSGTPLTYTCARCGGVYPRTRPETNLLSEACTMFGQHPILGLVLVCHPCFLDMERERVKAGVPLSAFQPEG